MKKGNQRQVFRSVVILAAILVFTTLVFIYREQIQQFEQLGYPGLFLISFFANSTIVFPLPGVLVTSAMGTVYHPFWVGLVAALGAALGEVSGYLAGAAGKLVVEERDWYDRIQSAMQKKGGWIIFLLAFIPNPLFDLAGIAAGALRIPLWRFFSFCFLGKLLKMLLFAYTGFSLFAYFS